MDITSKSLYRSNIVFVFEEGKFAAPENPVLASFYQGPAAVAAHFIDDPILRTKILDLPRLKLQISVEPNRLRIEDESQEEPENSILIKEAFNLYQGLFSQSSLVGFGFNFDIYYRFSDVIRLNDLFESLVDSKVLEKADLRDWGTQFTLEKQGGRKREAYLIKVTAPIEMAVHVNHHFSERKLPKQEQLTQLFAKCYQDTDEVIQNLKF